MEKKKSRSHIKTIGIIVLGLMAFVFAKDVWRALQDNDLTSLYSHLVSLIFLGIIFFIIRSSMKQGWDALLKRREAARTEFEKNRGDINIKEAALFSLSWSWEIYQNIPKDRKRLVKTSFILIGIGMGLGLIQVENINWFPVLIMCALILAGVNLLIWGVGSEREEKERIRYELETARRMQLSLMPDRAPEITGFDIAGCCIPAQDVGGDLFDFVWADKEHSRLCISVADVSGKGMNAALTAVYTSGALVSEAQHEEDVATVTRNLNTAVFSRKNRGRFVSMLVAALDVTQKRIEYVNAGQSRPLLIRGTDISELRGMGPRFPLGVRECPSYQAENMDLQGGDVLLFYTDGVTEAMNNDNEMFGDQRLKGILLDLIRDGLPAIDIVNSLKNRVLAFSGSAPQHDDLTIVALKVLV